MVPVLIAAEKEITGFAAVRADSIDENRAVVAAADVVPELDGFNAWGCARNARQIVCHGLIGDQFRGFADFFNSGFDVVCERSACRDALHAVNHIAIDICSRSACFDLQACMNRNYIAAFTCCEASHSDAGIAFAGSRMPTSIMAAEQAAMSALRPFSGLAPAWAGTPSK